MTKEKGLLPKLIDELGSELVKLENPFMAHGYRTITDFISPAERGADVLSQCQCRKCGEELNCSKTHGINDKHQESICGQCSG